MARRSRAAGVSCSRRSTTGRLGPNMKDRWTEPSTWADDRLARRRLRGAGRRPPAERDRLLLRRGRGRVERADIVRGRSDAGAGRARRADRADPLAGVADALGVTRRRSAPAAPAVGRADRPRLRLYWSRPRLFLGIGCCSSRSASLFPGVQYLIFHVGPLAPLVDREGDSKRSSPTLALALGLFLTISALRVVQAATAMRGGRLDAGREIAADGAYRRLLGRSRPLVRSMLGAAVSAASSSCSSRDPRSAVWLVAGLDRCSAQVVSSRTTRSRASLRRSGRSSARPLVADGLSRVIVPAAACCSAPGRRLVLLFVTAASFDAINLIRASSTRCRCRSSRSPPRTSTTTSPCVNGWPRRGGQRRRCRPRPSGAGNSTPAEAAHAQVERDADRERERGTPSALGASTRRPDCDQRQGAGDLGDNLVRRDPAPDRGAPGEQAPARPTSSTSTPSTSSTRRPARRSSMREERGRTPRRHPRWSRRRPRTRMRKPAADRECGAGDGRRHGDAGAKAGKALSTGPGASHSEAPRKASASSGTAHDSRFRSFTTFRAWPAWSASSTTTLGASRSALRRRDAAHIEAGLDLPHDGRPGQRTRGRRCRPRARSSAARGRRG